MNFSLSVTLFFVALTNINADSIKVTSRAGKKILSKARKLDNNDNAYDFSWMTDYSLKFESCHTVMSFDERGGEEENGDGSPVRNQGMIKFKLCPTATCGSSKSCNGPEYVAQMRDFVESYQEAKEAALEYACETVEENCACDDDGQDDEQCMSNCYTAAGISCGDDDGNNNEQEDVQEYLECRELGENDDAYQSYYVGGYCGDSGKSVYLSVFTDSGCTTKAESNSPYYNLYGAELPYTTTSMISDDCIDCAYDNGNDDAYAVEVSESCQQIYQEAGKCEEGFSDVITYPSTGGCTFINTILPGLEKLMERQYKIGSSAAIAWAWIFALSTFGLVGYVYMLTDGKFVQESKVNLSSNNAGGLA